MDHLALYIYIILIFIIFFSSSNQYFMNSTEHPPTLFSTCNQHCDCVDSEYHPVCAEFHDGKQTAFFSPCYAGCDKKYEPLQKVSFIKFSSYIFVIFDLFYFHCRNILKYSKNTGTSLLHCLFDDSRLIVFYQKKILQYF